MAYYKKEEVVVAHTKRQPKRIKGSRSLTAEEQFKIARLGTMRIWTLKQKLIKNEDTKI